MTAQTKAAKPNWSRFVPVRYLAQGGLGEVLLAEDTELNRLVALKRILGTTASEPEARRRFLLEAKITGRLEHPGVVPVYGLGTDPQTGQPSYAMRLIAGRTLKEAIEEFHSGGAGFNSVAFRKLIGSLVSAGQTLGYAHGKGIIHRDVKPANIMVGTHGETLVVDWGLAKEFSVGGNRVHGDQRGTVGSIASSTSGSATVEGAGTPGYMAPEQAAGELDKLGPAIDIYGLGATLYHLLTGQGPLARESTLAALSLTLTGEVPSARVVKPSVPGPLEAVCRKAMAHDPAQRYGSAEEMCADLERWLADEPVSCLREGVIERIARWIRRHPASVATSLAVFFFLGASALGVAVLFDYQRSVLDEKNQLIAQERDRAVAAEKAAGQERDRALAAEQAAAAEREEARALVGKCLDIARRDPAFWKSGAEQARELLLKMAVPYHERWARQTGILELRRHSVLAKYEAARQAADLGRSSAIELYRSCLAELEPLAAVNPNDRELRSYRSICYSRLSQLLKTKGEGNAAIMALKTAIEVQEKLAEENPKDTLALAQLARNYGQLALFQKELGNPAGAMAAYRAMIAIRQQQINDEPAVSEYRGELAKTYRNLGNLQRSLGNVQPALSSYREAVSVLEKLVADNPSLSEYRTELSDTHENIGSLLLSIGDQTGALNEYLAAKSLAEKVAAANPEFAHLQNDLANCHMTLGSLYSQMHRNQESLTEYRAALAIREKMLTTLPKGPKAALEVGDLHVKMGTLLHSMKLYTEAETALRRGLALREKLAAEHPNELLHQVNLAAVLNNLGNLQRDTKQYAASVRSHQAAVELLTKLVSSQPSASAYRKDLAGSHFHVALSAAAAQDTATAITACQAAVTLRQQLADANPDGVSEATQLAQALLQLGCLAFASGKTAEARPQLNTAIERLERVLKKVPQDVEARAFARDAYLSRAELLIQMGQPSEAVGDLKRALPLCESPTQQKKIQNRLRQAQDLANSAP